MIIESNNTHIIYKYLTHQDLWPHIAEDGISEYDFIPPTGSNIRWVFYVPEGEKELKGVIRVDIKNNTVFTFHVFMQKNHREHKVKMIKEFYLEMFKGTTFKKALVEFPSFMGHLKQFAFDMGMSCEGIISDCFMKGGELKGIEIMGISNKKALEVGAV